MLLFLRHFTSFVPQRMSAVQGVCWCWISKNWTTSAKDTCLIFVLQLASVHKLEWGGLGSAGTWRSIQHRECWELNTGPTYSGFLIWHAVAEIVMSHRNHRDNTIQSSSDLAAISTKLVPLNTQSLFSTWLKLALNYANRLTIEINAASAWGKKQGRMILSPLTLSQVWECQLWVVIYLVSL